jgi:hypothetical protein
MDSFHSVCRTSAPSPLPLLDAAALRPHSSFAMMASACFLYNPWLARSYTPYGGEVRALSRSWRLPNLSSWLSCAAAGSGSGSL